MKQSDDNKYIPMTSTSSGRTRELSDLFYYTNQIVNVVFIGKPQDNSWVLVDAGMPKSGQEIISVAEDIYGKGSMPSAIILTHGHFDHVGGITHLLKEWDVPVYAHPLEFPYLTNQKAYPEPDSSVQGGMLAKISAIYPHEPIDISGAVLPLPDDNSIPELPQWKWLHTPGHSPGHISLFREKDRLLISGDAIVTVKQDSLYKVLVQKKEVHGPPVYLTTDWAAAENSVRKLASLDPEWLISGHGSMSGQELKEGINNLVTNFKELAIPDHGKFVDNKNKDRS